MRKVLLSTIIFIALLNVSSYSRIGQSAIITLVFPYGARTTGMGETFTGLADDASAIYYNPAGLGQSPLATEWLNYKPVPNGKYTAIASNRTSFTNSQKIWLGTAANGVFRYNGKVWDNYDIKTIEQGETLRELVERYINSDNDRVIQEAMDKVKEFNNIGNIKEDSIKVILSEKIFNKDSLTNATKMIMALDAFDRTEDVIISKLKTLFGITISNTTAKAITGVFRIKTKSFSELVEIKLPFSIATTDTVTAIYRDFSDRIWVGTISRLWRYNGIEWKEYSTLSGLPSNRVNSIVSSSAGTVLVSTDKGIAEFKDGEWETINLGKEYNIKTTVFSNEDGIVYAASDRGVFKIKDHKITDYYTDSTGLLSKDVRALMFDSRNRLWIGGVNGITILDGTTFKRYKLPNTTVSTIVEEKKGIVWIGTDKGAVRYKDGPIRKDKNTGQKVQLPPSWKPYHTNNSLVGDNVSGITISGRDVWIATEEAVNHSNHGEPQITFFWEPLLPAFDLPDLWHANAAGIIPLNEWGTIGFLFNYINFGDNTKTSPLGDSVSVFRSYEFVAGVSYGINLKKNLSAGVNIKYAHSALDPTTVGGVGRTFAVDAAILKRNLFIKNLDIGFMMQNMGPSVFYTEKDNADPIPFELRLGLNYTPVKTPIHNLNLALDLEREIVYNENGSKPAPFWMAIYKGLSDEPWRDELSEVVVHMGLEYWYIYFIGLRIGGLIDEAGSRKELSLGVGLRYGKMGIDWSYINAPNKSEARNGQWRLDFTVKP